MKSQDKEYLKERVAILLKDGATGAIFSVDDVGDLLAEIDSLRESLQKLADEDYYSADMNGDISWTDLFSLSETPWDFAAAALKRSEGG